jgi:ABC-2 type transport system permease protein
MSTGTLTPRAEFAHSAEASHAWSQTMAMSKRSIIAIVRQPALIIPSLIFPLFFAALGASSFNRATQLPGFPKVDSFLALTLAASALQGVIFGSVTGGAALAVDIETGFFDRLLASPTSRVSILIGRLAGNALFGSIEALFFTLVMIPFGVNIRSGPAGIAVITLAGGLIGLSIGGFMAAMALRTGSAEAVQGVFPLLFVSMFFSSAFFPRETMQGIYRTIANYNPLSHLYEGMRDLVISGWSFDAVLKSLLIPVGIGCVSIPLALLALRRRLRAV